MTKAEVLEKAASIVSGTREQNYGKPEDNFATIAQIWNAILRRTGKLTDFGSIDAHDVALCMVGVKLAREAHIHSDDNCVDGAGYFACAADVMNPTQASIDKAKAGLEELQRWQTGMSDARIFSSNLSIR